MKDNKLLHIALCVAYWISLCGINIAASFIFGFSSSHSLMMNVIIFVTFLTISSISVLVSFLYVVAFIGAIRSKSIEDLETLQKIYNAVTSTTFKSAKEFSIIIISLFILSIIFL